MTQSLEPAPHPEVEEGSERPADATLRGIARRWPVASATLAGAVAVLVQSVGYAWGWNDLEMRAIVCWYVGFAMLVVPFAALLLGATRTDHQRLGGVLSFTLLFYLSWLLTNPVMATRFDESLHVTTLTTMVDGAGFFAPNSMLPVSPHYPGLELAAGAVHWMSGLPLMACQVLVVLVARTVFVLALFMIASRIGRSTRIGATVVVLYTASAQFYFFNAQFSYQTVAIAMLMAAMYLLVRAFDSRQERPWVEMGAVQVCLAALTVTHHLTSWLVLGAIWVFVVLFRLSGERRRYRLTLITAELATVVMAAWTAVIAPLLVDYLGPIFEGATTELAGIIALDGSQRQIGSSPSGVATPTWEFLVMSGSILLWCLLLLPAGWAAWKGRTIGRTRARLLPLALAMSFPLLQLGRFSESAGEIGDRASTFITMAMALVVGAWLVPRMKTFGRFVVPGAVVLILGGTILGSGPDWQRVPGPYLAGAEQRSVDAETVAFAQWAGKYLPDGSIIATDVTLSRVTPNFAKVVAATQAGGLANVTPLFIYQGIGDTDLQLIKDNQIDFVVVDTRMIGQTALSGSFFDGGAGYGPLAQTLNAAQLDKFEDYPSFVKVLDGPIRVYDVRGLSGQLPTFTDRPDPGVPGDWEPWQVLVTALVGVAALRLRGGLLNPMRFKARDMWRPAVVLPALMAIGALGVLTGFAPWRGSIVLAAVVGALVLATRRPVTRASRRIPPGTGWWALVIGSVVMVSVVIAFVAAWHGMFDIAPLPAPVSPTLS